MLSISEPARQALIMTAAIGSAVVSGIFLAFSSFVMPALNRISPDRSTAAMDAINKAAKNPVFAATFFGTALACVAVALLFPPGMATAGAVLYLTGAIGITFARNLPLNERLTSLEWSAYAVPWTRWNHLRTVTSLAAAALLCLSLTD